MSDENVFNQGDNNQPDPNAQLTAQIEALKKQSVEELAKKGAHADQFIEHLQNQIKELNEELKKRVTAEALVEELKNKPTKSEEREEHTPQVTSPEDIESLVEKALERKTAEKTFTANQLTVDAEVKKKYGDKAKEFIEQKSQELGLTKQELGALAGKSPAAFFNLVGMAAPKMEPAPSKSTVNSSAVQPTNVTAGTWRYYEELRKKDPVAYHNPKLQQQLFKDRIRLGEDFYK